MAIECNVNGYGRYLVLFAVIIAFIVIVSGEGYCDIVFNPGIIPIHLPPYITVSPNPAYVGQTMTFTGSGFCTTPFAGDSYPIAYCNAYVDEHGNQKPIQIQSDGRFSVQTAPLGAGSLGVFATDKWGNKSNTVDVVITEPVTFSITLVDGKGAPYVTNGVLCVKYPASANSHYENSIAGSTYTTKMAYNGTSAEIWVRQNPMTTDHKTIPDIQAGQTYSVTLTMPVNTPTPTAGLGTATPTPGPQATPDPGSATVTPPGAPDTIAPVTTLNFTGIKDASGAFTSTVICTLTAADNDGGSGINDSGYSFDGSNWTPYAGPFTITTPGNMTVFYRSADKAGNQEVARVEAVTIAGSASATAGGQQGAGCGIALLLPLLSAGFVGLYRMKKGRQK